MTYLSSNEHPTWSNLIEKEIPLKTIDTYFLLLHLNQSGSILQVQTNPKWMFCHFQLLQIHLENWSAWIDWKKKSCVLSINLMPKYLTMPPCFQKKRWKIMKQSTTAISVVSAESCFPSVASPPSSTSPHLLLEMPGWDLAPQHGIRVLKSIEFVFQVFQVMLYFFVSSNGGKKCKLCLFVFFSSSKTRNSQSVTPNSWWPMVDLLWFIFEAPGTSVHTTGCSGPSAHYLVPTNTIMGI